MQPQLRLAAVAFGAMAGSATGPYTGNASGFGRECCRAGRLRFDLEPEALLLTGSAAAAPLDCDHP
jgi:hypothetical protein